MPYAEVIGDPVAHSKSPAIHNFWLEKRGFDGDYRAVQVTEDGLGAYFDHRRADAEWRGCNVTVPHKQAVIPFLDELGPLASEVGAANTVFRHGESIAGGNSDVNGILDAVQAIEPGRLVSACLIGSGGAAMAAVAAFRLLGIERLTINARDRAKGEALLAGAGMPGRVGAIDDRANLKRAQLIVNATTLGMEGQAAMPEALLDAMVASDNDAAIVFDMVYAPLETALLAAARRRGLRTIDGLQMLVGQAAVAFEVFFGIPAPREHDAELRALLTS